MKDNKKFEDTIDIDLCYFNAGVLTNNLHSEENTKKWFKLIELGILFIGFIIIEKV